MKRFWLGDFYGAPVRTEYRINNFYSLIIWIYIYIYIIGEISLLSLLELPIDTPYLVHEAVFIVNFLVKIDPVFTDNCDGPVQRIETSKA